MAVTFNINLVVFLLSPPLIFMLSRVMPTDDEERMFASWSRLFNMLHFDYFEVVVRLFLVNII